MGHQTLRTAFDIGEGRQIDHPNRAAALFAQLQGLGGGGGITVRGGRGMPGSLLEGDRAHRRGLRAERAEENARQNQLMALLRGETREDRARSDQLDARTMARDDFFRNLLRSESRQIPDWERLSPPGGGGSRGAGGGAGGSRGGGAGAGGGGKAAAQTPAGLGVRDSDQAKEIDELLAGAAGRKIKALSSGEMRDLKILIAGGGPELAQYAFTMMKTLEISTQTAEGYAPTTDMADFLLRLGDALVGPGAENLDFARFGAGDKVEETPSPESAIRALLKDHERSGGAQSLSQPIGGPGGYEDLGAGVSRAGFDFPTGTDTGSRELLNQELNNKILEAYETLGPVSSDPFPDWLGPGGGGSVRSNNQTEMDQDRERARGLGGGARSPTIQELIQSTKQALSARPRPRRNQRFGLNDPASIELDPVDPDAPEPSPEKKRRERAKREDKIMDLFHKSIGRDIEDKNRNRIPDDIDRELEEMVRAGIIRQEEMEALANRLLDRVLLKADVYRVLPRASFQGSLRGN